MGFNMKGSPAKLGTIKGTAGHASALKMKAEADAASALKDLGHGGHPNMTKSQAAAATHGGKMSDKDKQRRVDADSPQEYTDKSFKDAYRDRGDKYKDMNEEDYTKEAKRQKVIHEKTGKWDVKDSYAPSEPKKKVEVKKEIKVEKEEGKVEARKPESDEGKKITPKERATIKGKKLRSKVKADVEAGKKGLGSKIRKYRAARKTKKNIKKYGVTPTADELT